MCIDIYIYIYIYIYISIYAHTVHPRAAYSKSKWGLEDEWNLHKLAFDQVGPHAGAYIYIYIYIYVCMSGFAGIRLLVFWF